MNANHSSEMQKLIVTLNGIWWMISFVCLRTNEMERLPAVLANRNATNLHCLHIIYRETRQISPIKWRRFHKLSTWKRTILRIWKYKLTHFSAFLPCKFVFCYQLNTCFCLYFPVFTTIFTFRRVGVAKTKRHASRPLHTGKTRISTLW